jgi:simple sugar transport system ATP-binding protein
VKLELRGITKRFPGVVANQGIDLVVQPGEIHGLLGENGAGKSTLMNVLYGLYAPDEGEILIDDKPVQFNGPGDAIAAGIGMVHQHFMLVPVFTVTENIMLGVEETRGPLGALDRGAARERIVEISERHGLKVDPDALVEDLPVGVRQRVEILKTLYRKSDVLILDEPSAVLTPQETEELVAVMRSLVEGGTSIVFITHKLNEVLEVTDRITVLRRGRVAGSATPAETTREELATMMVGREVDLVVDKTPAKPGEPVLELRDVVVRDDRGHPAVNGLSLTVRAGEIVAIAGVHGNGQSELVEAITGLRDVDEGEVRINGTVFENDPRAVYAAGVAHVPEDRMEDGLIGDFTVADNMVLTGYWREPFSSGLRLNGNAIVEAATELVDQFDVRTPSIFNAVGNLSGGNQQKVIAAREFSRPLELIVASQPTRGLDVGSIEYIHSRIVQKRDEGTAVLIVSTELEEVVALADRIAVMFQGKIVDTIEPAEATFERLGLLMGGAHPEETQPEEAAERAAAAAAGTSDDD